MHVQCIVDASYLHLASQETRGEPDALIVSHLPYGPTAHFSLSGAVMRHDIEGRGTVSEAFPHLIFQVRRLLRRWGRVAAIHCGASASHFPCRILRHHSASGSPPF